jgi:DNA-binding CsgD family transcriptional regulator
MAGFPSPARGRGVMKSERRRKDAELETRKRSLTERALIERIKELNCLYNVSKLFGRKDLSMEEILERLVGILLPAWQHVHIASARLVLDKQPYASANFKETSWKLREEISVFKRRAGFVEVCYVRKPGKTGASFFLPAEKKLLRSVAELIGSLVEQRESQTILEQSAELLQAQKQELEEKNIALKEILARIEIEKKEMEERFSASIEKLVVPIVRKLGNRHLEPEQAEKYRHLLMTNLEGITSDYARKMSDDRARLSPREVEICGMVKDGLSSKEIADLLRISVLTVERHRHNARRTFGLAGGKFNLATYLRKI